MNNNKKEKIGILGGTFNPIHTGHLILAENAFNFFNLDKILIMPSGCSYLKDQSLIAPKTDRINMVSLAIKDNEHFELSTIETDREGNSYTCETLALLKEANPNSEYYFIIGADTLFSIETWRKPEEIFRLCTIIAAPRNSGSGEELNRQIEYLNNKFNADIRLLTSGNFDVSSSTIRKQLKNGKSIKYYVPDSVIEYIKNNCLYK